MTTHAELTLLVRRDALRAELEAERARADHAELRVADLERINAGLRGLAQDLITRLDRVPVVREDGPGDVW